MVGCTTQILLLQCGRESPFVQHPRQNVYSIFVHITAVTMDPVVSTARTFDLPVEEPNNAPSLLEALFRLGPYQTNDDPAAEGEWDDDEFDDDYDDFDGYNEDDGAVASQLAAVMQEPLDAPANTFDGSAPAHRASTDVSKTSAAAASSKAVAKANAQPAPQRAVQAQPRDRMLLDRYGDKIKIDMLDNKAAGVARHTGRDDRATVEQVLDPRTRLILFKLLSQGLISEINGCVSTGKEANVYHARRPNGTSLAIKIYKTSILVFKDRDRYVSGEYRFRSGYSRSNPRKMVKLWAEKEMRNLKRLHQAGLPVPDPVLLRLHVLVMDFLGDEEGWPSPRLRDAGLSTSKMMDAYMDVVDIMRTMYQTCRLVHADLSEYNLLWHENRVFVIDVSQSVETDHPRATEFLRMDCQNITDYFRRAGVTTMTPRELFDYVVHARLGSKELEQAYLDEARQRAEARAASGQADPDADNLTAAIAADAEAQSAAESAAAASVDEAVFMQAYIPSSLAGVRDVEADTDAVTRGEASQLYYAALAGLTPAPAAQAQDSSKEGGGAGQSGDEDDDSDSDSDDGEEEEGEQGEGEEGSKQWTRKEADKEERKKHKADVKAAAREKRKTKIPKHVKKRHAKTSK